MATIAGYRSCIQTLLEQHSHSNFQNEEVENEFFFDTVRDHYQLMRVGWKGLSRVYQGLSNTLISKTVKFGSSKIRLILISRRA